VGWAGPNNWAGLSPKRVGPISAQQFSFLLVWARPGPESKAGPESVWPTKTSGLGQNQPGPTKETHQCWASTSLAQHQKSNEGGIIFPLPSSCVQNEGSACRRKQRNEK